MKDFLRKAFAYVHHAIDILKDTYDRTGCFAMRLLMDDTLFSIQPDSLESPLLQRAIKFYGWGKDKAQEALFDQIHSKASNGNMAPKPDIKPGLFKLAQSTFLLLPKIGITPHSAAIAFSAAAVGTATYLLYQAGTPSALNEASVLFDNDKREKTGGGTSPVAAMPSVQPSVF